MRLKDLFTVPTGQKVTEKHLRRVLISSISSILLCMSCLVGSTWAWFAVSIENTGNVIEIGTPEIKLTVNGESFMFRTTLQPETYKVSMEHANGRDDFQKKSTLYVTLMIDESTTVYTTLNHENEYKQEFTIVANEEFSLSWNVSWFAPANATELIGNIITLNPIVNNTVTSDAAGTDESTQTEQDDASESLEASEYSEPSEEDSEPSGEDSNDSSESGEVKTESTEESSEEAATEPTEEIQATETTEESSTTEEEEESTLSLEESTSSETSESTTTE